jgi:endonuclease YncB( thermonuclease family)
MRTFGIIVALLLASHATAAETLSVRVIGISDGDTLTVLVEKRQVKVRINGIDAPKKGQAFAERSKQNFLRGWHSRRMRGSNATRKISMDVMSARFRYSRTFVRAAVRRST